MCGICCFLFLDSGNSSNHCQTIYDSVLPHLQRRGPDHIGRKDFSAANDHRMFSLSLVGTVLHLRGSKTPQPLEDEYGNILLWNGEIFGGIEVKENENDSLILLNNLSNPPSEVIPSQHIISTMAKAQGPWAFVYWQMNEQKLWFGRDYFGRRSLLWHVPTNPLDVLAVTSVTERNSAAADTNLHFEEVPADGLYCIEFATPTTDKVCEQPFRMNKFEWKISSEELQNSRLFLPCPVIPFNKQMPTERDIQDIEENRRLLGLLANTCDENATKLEETCSKEGKKSIENENTVGQGSKKSIESDITVGDGSEKRTVENGMSNLGTVENAPDGANLECDSKPTQHETLLKDNVCGLDVNAKFSSPNPTSNTKDYFEARLSKSQSCDSIKSTSPMRSGDSVVYQDACLQTLCDESTVTAEPREAANISSTGVVAEACSRCDLLRSTWNSSYKESRDKFIAVLGDAVRKRVWNLPRSNSDSVTSSFSSGITSEVNSFTSLSGVQCKDARVGILFSGGIDSMMIAALADKFVPTEEAIDLINVAFEQKYLSGHPQNKNTKKGKTRKNIAPIKPARNFSVPDRITGISGLEELQCINPSRQWNFIEVDVTLEELQEMRSRHISHLVSPLNTVLDDSIGCALWFAARGVGRLRSFSVSSGLDKDSEGGTQEKNYTSKAKVLLVGMGADEQLGGYARHRTRFDNEGWAGLMDEMEMEVRRISKRNLGRDDRCISDHGREARFPFLDEDVVSFLNSLPVWLKLMIFHLRLNILQKAGKWVRSHTQRKTEVQKLTKKFFVKNDDDFAIATEAVEEQPSDFERCDKSKEKNSSYQSGGRAGRSCCGKKNKLKFKRNTVTPSERHAWNENSAGKGKKRHSHTLRLLGSRSAKASNVKSDFDKPYHKNADVR